MSVVIYNLIFFPVILLLNSGMIDRLSKMGLSDTVVKWLEGDPSNSFFEFKLASDERTEE
jgi:hypothetical protein